MNLSPRLRIFLTLMSAASPLCSANLLAQELHEVIRMAQAKVVKIYGAGGLRQMEAYQSGILISPEGHMLTVMSYVLDTDDLAIVLDDGRKFAADFVGSDPVRELAVFRLQQTDETFPYFDLGAEASVEVGERVLALSNLYGIASGEEPVSVLQGVLTAVAPLEARRGAFQSNLPENVLIVDAYSNNPGAAGGALINWRGDFLGLLGKELRSRVTGTWLNYALPRESIANSAEAILSGRSLDAPPPFENVESELTLEKLGIRLIPDVVHRTPPYIDVVVRNSPAEEAGLKPDDLVVFVAGRQVVSCKSLVEELKLHDAREELSLGVLRDGQLLEVMLPPKPEKQD